jgi:hypothetical protein
MVAVLGPYEALPYYIHTYIHTYIQVGTLSFLSYYLLPLFLYFKYIFCKLFQAKSLTPEIFLVPFTFHRSFRQRLYYFYARVSSTFILSGVRGEECVGTSGTSTLWTFGSLPSVPSKFSPGHLFLGMISDGWNLHRVSYLASNGKFPQLRRHVRPCQLLPHAHSWPPFLCAVLAGLGHFWLISRNRPYVAAHIRYTASHHEVRDYINYTLLWLIVRFFAKQHVSVSKLI